MLTVLILSICVAVVIVGAICYLSGEAESLDSALAKTSSTIIYEKRDVVEYRAMKMISFEDAQKVDINHLSFWAESDLICEISKQLLKDVEYYVEADLQRQKYLIRAQLKVQRAPYPINLKEQLEEIIIK